MSSKELIIIQNDFQNEWNEVFSFIVLLLPRLFRLAYCKPEDEKNSKVELIGSIFDLENVFLLAVHL